MRGARIRHLFWGKAKTKVDTFKRSAMSVEESRSKDEVIMRRSEEGDSASSHLNKMSAKTGLDSKRRKIHATEDNNYCAESSTPQPIQEPQFQSVRDIGRRWNFTGRDGQKHRSRSVPFTMISYNVLADYLLQSHPMLYENCEKWVLEWEYRKKNLIKEILFYDADILCLQEVQEKHYYDWFHPELTKAGYQGLYKRRTGEKYDGCAIFFRKNKFTLLHFRFLDYRMDHVPLMDKDNIAIFALLYPKYKDGTTCYNTALCVVNTHLLFNRNRGDIKLLQLASLFAEIDKLKREFLVDGHSKKSSSRGVQKLPIVLCGDFNMTPTGDLYKYITTGFLDYKNLNKKNLSGQNFAAKQVFLNNSQDCIRENIIPQEMGLTNSSEWDVRTGSNVQTVNATTTANYEAEWPSLTSTSTASSDNSRPISHKEMASHPQRSSSKHPSENMQQNRQEPPKQSQFDPLSTIIRHKLFFFSTYKHFFNNRVRNVTTYHGKEPGVTVDYIFSSPGRNEMCRACKKRHSIMELTGYLNLLSEEEVSHVGGLPSRTLSSDHLSLVASFALHL